MKSKFSAILKMYGLLSIYIIVLHVSVQVVACISQLKHWENLKMYLISWKQTSIYLHHWCPVSIIWNTQNNMLISPRFTACRWRQRWLQLKKPSPGGLTAVQSSEHRSSTSWLIWWKLTWRSLPKLSPETKVSYTVLWYESKSQSGYQSEFMNKD